MLKIIKETDVNVLKCDDERQLLILRIKWKKKNKETPIWIRVDIPYKFKDEIAKEEFIYTERKRNGKIIPAIQWNRVLSDGSKNPDISLAGYLHIDIKFNKIGPYHYTYCIGNI